jgi:hypothetical protein
VAAAGTAEEDRECAGESLVVKSKISLSRKEGT